MKILQFNRLIAKKEGKKKAVNIAQINEIMKIANELSNGRFYRIIKSMDQKGRVVKKKCLIGRLFSLCR